MTTETAIQTKRFIHVISAGAAQLGTVLELIFGRAEEAGTLCCAIDSRGMHISTAEATHAMMLTLRDVALFQPTWSEVSTTGYSGLAVRVLAWLGELDDVQKHRLNSTMMSYVSGSLAKHHHAAKGLDGFEAVVEHTKDGEHEMLTIVPGYV